ncbi:SH3 domain-containing protein [Thiolapillus sp.]
MISQRLFAQSAILILTLAVLVGCETPPEKIVVEPPKPVLPQQPDPELIAARETISNLQAEVTKLKKLAAVQKEKNLELQLQLLEKQSRIAQLLQAHSRVVQEVVRAKARLRSRHSKAETVANLAELKLSLKNAESQNAGEQPHILQRARQFLTMAEAELDNNNFEGASYLMGQARRTLARTKAPETGNVDPDSAFPVPLQLKLKTTGNVRSGPSRKQQALFQLKAGTEVSAIDRNGLWVQIRTPEGKTGWVHFSLLKTI